MSEEVTREEYAHLLQSMVRMAKELTSQVNDIDALTARVARLEATIEGLKSTKGKRKTQMPSVNEFIARYPDFSDWVDEKFPEILSHKGTLTEMHDFHSARGTTMLSWEAAARTWFRNAAKFDRNGRGSTNSATESFDERDERLRLIKRAEFLSGGSQR